MSADLYQGYAPTYASLLAAYPEKGAALAALPVGAVRYVEDMQCEVRRSSNGKFWNPVMGLTGPQIISPTDQLTIIGPASGSVSSNGSQARTAVRATYYRMPGNRPGTLKTIQIYCNTYGVVGATTSGFDVRLYTANPDGSPRFGVAPMYVWSFNNTGTGTGGAGPSSGTCGLLNFEVAGGLGGTWQGPALPGGDQDVPAHFWIACRHDFTTTVPDVTAISQTSPSGDAAIYNVAAGTAAAVRTTSYGWAETTFTAGAFTVWDAAAEPLTSTQRAITPLFGIAV